MVACSATIWSSIDSAVHGVAVSTQPITNSTWSQSLFMYPACAKGTGIESDVVVRAEDVAEPGRRLERAVVEPRALGQPGGAARPHDAHRILGPSHRPAEERSAGLPHRCDLGARHEHLGCGCVGGKIRVGALVQQRDRLAPLQDRGDLARAEPGVDAGCDRAEARARGVGHRVVDARRHRERHDVTRLHPASAELRGQRVGAGEPLAVGQPLVTVDVGEGVGLAGADLLEQVAERGARHRRWRGAHSGSAAPRRAAQPSGSTPSVVMVRRVMSHSPSTTPNSSR